jgi:hypothetical protein
MRPPEEAEARYYVTLVFTSFRHRGVQYKDVLCRLCHPPGGAGEASGEGEEYYERLITDGLDRKDPYLKSQVDDTFTAEEVKGLRKQFTPELLSPEVTGAVAFIAEGAAPPWPGGKHISAFADIGYDVLVEFGKEEGWLLPYDVWGCWNLVNLAEVISGGSR